jgi:DNA-binding NtrC family response regulator
MIIVCVDDDESILATVAGILRHEDSTVRTTTSPAQAINWISTERVAVLVSDYNMPEMNGAQLTGYARVIRPTTVRVLLSACQGPEAAIDGVNQGEIFRFVAKPLNPHSFRNVVAAAVSRHQELLHGLTADKVDQSRNQLLSTVEKRYPGVTRFETDSAGGYHVSSDLHAAALTMEPAFRDLLLTAKRST